MSGLKEKRKKKTYISSLFVFNINGMYLKILIIVIIIFKSVCLFKYLSVSNLTAVIAT